MKAFLGMGLLGKNFVKALLQKGDKVQVWNRTTTRAKELETFGAVVLEDVADAVKGANIVHLTLKDDASVNEVLATAEQGFMPGAVIIDHTTTSAKGAVERSELWKEKGFSYLHAPVFMGPQNALESTGVMLVSGNQELIGQLEPQLAKMTGRVLNLGADLGKAAGIKLTGNLFLISLTAGLSDALALAKVHDISTADIQNLFSIWNPGAMVPARLQRMIDANFDNPSWELSMARKDAGLMLDAAQEVGATLTVIQAVAGVMDQWIERGYGNNDWTVISKNNL